MIARVLRATTSSDAAALRLAVIWHGEIGRLERAAPGYEGGMLLREGRDLLAVSCWANLPDHLAALDPLLAEVEGSAAAALLSAPLSCRVRFL